MNMISKKIQEAFNAQINAELFSAYLYMSMAAYFDNKNLSGFANWMKVQTQEEMTHAQKFYDFIIERGGRAEMRAIDKPKSDWESTKSVFEETYKHEQHVTALINDLVDLSLAEKDHAAYNFLQWFVNEQVEEEASADEILQKLIMIGDFGPGVYMMDKDLAARVFTPPAPKA
jgi:ferritin